MPHGQPTHVPSAFQNLLQRISDLLPERQPQVQFRQLPSDIAKEDKRRKDLRQRDIQTDQSVILDERLVSGREKFVTPDEQRRIIGSLADAELMAALEIAPQDVLARLGMDPRRTTVFDQGQKGGLNVQGGFSASDALGIHPALASQLEASKVSPEARTDDRIFISTTPDVDQRDVYLHEARHRGLDILRRAGLIPEATSSTRPEEGFVRDQDLRFGTDRTQRLMSNDMGTLLAVLMGTLPQDVQEAATKGARGIIRRDRKARLRRAEE